MQVLAHPLALGGPLPTAARRREGDDLSEVLQMSQQDKSSNETDAQHRGEVEEARPNEAGRSGGQHAPQGGGQSESSPQQDVEREKGEKGQGSPA